MHDTLKKAFPLILFIVVTLSVLSYLQFSYTKLQQDDYFHIRYAQMMRQNGPYRQFPWLRYTILNEKFYDKHFLYHVLLIPFSFGDLIFWGKVASIVFAIALGTLFYWFLKHYKIRYPLFWSLLFIFGSKSFLIRLLAIRPITFAAAFFIFIVHFLFQKKYVWLVIVNYLFVLSYSAFILSLVISVVYTLSYLIYHKEFSLKPILFTLAGIAAGIIVNPYFPANIPVLYAQYFKGSLVRSGLEPNLEWLPLSSWNLFLTAWVVIGIFFVVLLISLINRKKYSSYAVFFFIQTSIFFISYLKVSRGIDQFLPFALLFSAFAFTETEIKIPKVARIIIVLFPLVPMVMNSLYTVKSFDRISVIDNSGSARWLMENTEKNSHVFIANYGAFPQLFFYNQHNTYTLGLDPNYMKEYDEKLYRLYQDAIWLRKDPYSIIRGVFRAQFVHVENVSRSIEFYNYLDAHPGQFQKVYQDGFSAAFQVR